MQRRTAGRTKNRRSRIFMFSSAPSRAGVEGWPGAWKRSLGLADFAGLLAWRQFRPHVGAVARPSRSAARYFCEQSFLIRIANSERCAAVAAAVPYSALQSRGGDGFFTFSPGTGQGERTVFPCTKSAVMVGGALARCG